MCSLLDVRYALKQGDELAVYEIDHHGNPAYLVGSAHRMEPRNLEQWFWRIWNDIQPSTPYHCRCGGEFGSWTSVMDHCGMYPCRDCQTPTPQWDGWNYRCPACDKAANPGYHERNPGYYQSG